MNQEKEIETQSFYIKENLICIENVMMQISNVSSISSSGLEPLKFPWIALAMCAVAVYMILNEYAGFVAFAIFFGGGVWIIGWIMCNLSRAEKSNLRISLNSGEQYMVRIENDDFLMQVLGVLEQIMIDGGAGNQTISVSIHGCNITGNAKVIDNLQMRK